MRRWDTDELSNHKPGFRFGDADVVMVFVDTAVLADAAATSKCNLVKGEDVEASVKEGVRYEKKTVLFRGTLIEAGASA